MRSKVDRVLLIGAAAALALSAGEGAPVAAAAQTAPPAGPPPQTDADCQQQKTGDTIVGVLIGAVIGGIFGSNIAAAGHRGDGTALGAGLGAFGGGLAGASAANCGTPQTYYDNGAYKQGYADSNVRYGAPSSPPSRIDNAPPPTPRQSQADIDNGYTDAPPPTPPAPADQHNDDIPSGNNG